MKRIPALLLALLILTAGFASAKVKVVTPGEDAYYLDTANVLSEETEGAIYFSNKLLEEKTGAQIAVVALDSIGNADTYEYTYNLFNEWGIGSSKENNGFLLLMTIKEDDYYALPGGGVDKIFPSSTLKALYDEHLETDFAARNYDAGALKFFNAVFEKYADYYNLDISVADGIADYKEFVAAGNTLEVNHDYTIEPESKGPGILTWVILIAIVLIIINSRNNKKNGSSSTRTGGSSRSSMPFIFAPRINFGSGFNRSASTGTRRTYTPRSFGSSSTSRRTDSSSGSSGRSIFGGRSGFGGGSFGGGRSFGGGAGRGRR